MQVRSTRELANSGEKTSINLCPRILIMLRVKIKITYSNFKEIGTLELLSALFLHTWIVLGPFAGSGWGVWSSFTGVVGGRKERIANM